MSTTPDVKVTEHNPGSSFEEGGQWHTPCSCGRRFASTTPSKAQGRQRRHAEEETRKSGSAPKAVPVSPRAKVCGCGCGEPLAPKAGGLFRSGHDARFKSMLTAAHASGEKIRHPLDGQSRDALEIADWLDIRRGGGDFWRSKVLAGHKPAPVRPPRAPKVDPTPEERGAVRAARVMEMMQTRRPVAGDVGIVTLRSGGRHGARVVRRQDQDAVQIQFLDGPSRGEKVIVADHRFKKGAK